MRIAIKALAGSLIILCAISSLALSWTDSDYALYDYESFSQLTEANQRINMKNINYPLLSAAIFFETNRQRALNGRDEFRHSPALEQAAQEYSVDMVKYNMLSHTSPRAGRETMDKRLRLVGISAGYRGENIADTFGLEYIANKPVYSPSQNGGYFSYKLKGKPILNHTYVGFGKRVVNEWMNSPGHRANILKPDFTYLGAGAYHYKRADFGNMDCFKATQEFSSTPGGETIDEELDF